MEHEFTELHTREFLRAATECGRSVLSLFDCKCCLMSSYGIAISRKELRAIWMSLPTMSCNSDEEIMTQGIDLDTYLLIIQAVLASAGVNETMLQNKVYEVFDRTRKGFVSLPDFLRVLETSNRMHLARRCGHSIFLACDDLQIKKISSTQVKSIVLRGILR